MFKVFPILVFCMISVASAEQTALPQAVEIDLEVRALNGDKKINLASEFQGKVILVVNTASKCGFTHQYEGLEKIYSEYKDQGLAVLGFPSNEFRQEPGTEKNIQEFCRLTYSVQFPMFEKTQVRPENADSLFKVLGEAANEYPAWNFHKYLIDREGNLVGSYKSHVPPDQGVLLDHIRELL